MKNCFELILLIYILLLYLNFIYWIVWLYVSIHIHGKTQHLQNTLSGSYIDSTAKIKSLTVGKQSNRICIHSVFTCLDISLISRDLAELFERLRYFLLFLPVVTRNDIIREAVATSNIQRSLNDMLPARGSFWTHLMTLCVQLLVWSSAVYWRIMHVCINWR